MTDFYFSCRGCGHQVTREFAWTKCSYCGNAIEARRMHHQDNMTKITSSINAPSAPASQFDALHVGDFLISSNGSHTGMKLNDSSIRWFPNTPDEYSSDGRGIEYGISGLNIYALPVSVAITTTR